MLMEEGGGFLQWRKGAYSTAPPTWLVISLWMMKFMAIGQMPV